MTTATSGATSAGGGAAAAAATSTTQDQRTAQAVTALVNYPSSPPDCYVEQHKATLISKAKKNSLEITAEREEAFLFLARELAAPRWKEDCSMLEEEANAFFMLRRVCVSDRRAGSSCCIWDYTPTGGRALGALGGGVGGAYATWKVGYPLWKVVRVGFGCAAALQCAMTAHGPFDGGHTDIDPAGMANAAVIYALFGLTGLGAMAGQYIGAAAGCLGSVGLEYGALGFNSLFKLWPIRECAQVLETRLTEWLEAQCSQSPESSPIRLYRCLFSGKLPDDPIRVGKRICDRSVARQHRGRAVFDQAPSDHRIIAAILGCKRKFLSSAACEWDAKLWAPLVCFSKDGDDFPFAMAEDSDLPQISNDLALAIITLKWDLGSRIKKAKQQALAYIEQRAKPKTPLSEAMARQLEIAIAGEQAVDFVSDTTLNDPASLRTWLAGQQATPGADASSAGSTASDS